MESINQAALCLGFGDSNEIVDARDPRSRPPSPI